MIHKVMTENELKWEKILICFDEDQKKIYSKSENGEEKKEKKT